VNLRIGRITPRVYRMLCMRSKVMSYLGGQLVFILAYRGTHAHRRVNASPN